MEAVKQVINEIEIEIRADPDEDKVAAIEDL